MEEKELVVTLWEERAFKFQQSVSLIGNEAIFVVVTGLLAKKFSDKVTLSSTDATRTYFDIDYTPLNDLKTALSKADGNGTALLTCHLRQSKQFVTTRKNTVQQISIKNFLETELPTGTDLVRCRCKAKIIQVLNGNGWFYICCPECSRTVRPTEGKYSCSNCIDTDSAFTQRYHLVIQVEDESGTTTFTLFNKEAEQPEAEQPIGVH